MYVVQIKMRSRTRPDEHEEPFELIYCWPMFLRTHNYHSALQNIIKIEIDYISSKH